MSRKTFEPHIQYGRNSSGWYVTVCDNPEDALPMPFPDGRLAALRARYLSKLHGFSLRRVDLIKGVSRG